MNSACLSQTNRILLSIWLCKILSVTHSISSDKINFFPSSLCYIHHPHWYLQYESYVFLDVEHPKIAVCSKHKESNILKHKKQITSTITNCYRRNIGLSNDFPISPVLFWSVFLTSIVVWVLAFVKRNITI